MADNESAVKTIKSLIALGIVLEHASDETILNSTALPRLQYAQHLAKHAHAFEDFTDLLQRRLASFEEHYPEFPIEAFVDRIFEENVTLTEAAKADVNSVIRQCVATLEGRFRELCLPGTFMDRTRQEFPDFYSSLLEAAAADSSILNETLSRLENRTLESDFEGNE
jgi:hypothetical protein